MTARSFVKMHGLGNDFVLLDARRQPLAMTADLARAVADRHRGVGCDQVIVIEPSARAAARLRFWNADGGESGACGNGSRCAAALLAEESGQDELVLETAAGLLPARRETDGRIAVDLGPARSDWAEIPLAQPFDTLHLPLARGPLRDPAALSLGNPHVTFFVADAEAVDLTTLGPSLEHDPLFPQRANVAAVSLLGPDRLRVRVWERGAGLTQACGTGASAAAVNAARRGLVGRRVETQLDGGWLSVFWRPDNRVEMAGPVARVFTGAFAEALA